MFKFTILTFLIFSAVFYFFYWKNINFPLDKKGETVNFVIKNNESSSEIAAQLEKTKIISSKKYFQLYLWKNDLGDKLQAGSYRLSPQMNIQEIADILVQGKIEYNEKQITIIPGWTNFDIENNLIKKHNFKHEDLKILSTPLKDLTGPFSENLKKFWFLNNLPKNATLEGFLYPDTYNVFENANIEDIILKVLQQGFNRQANLTVKEEAQKQEMSFYETLILASIVQKESLTKEEMPIVAGIFLNRLRNNIRLQSDATLSYILKDKDAAHDYKATQVDSPFNTYKHKGLPPSPISNPSITAINAVIHPTQTNYLYFLHRLRDGKIFYAQTYEDHLNNKRKYLNN